MSKLLIGLAALAVTAFIACGGGSSKAPATGSATTPAPTTAVPVVIDEVWAAEQVMPVLKTGLELARDQEWSKFYDGLSADSKTKCSRTEFVTNMTGSWLFAQAFGFDKILEAALQDIEDGTLPLSFGEISADRISYRTAPEDSLTTIVREDGEWHGVDDGTCGSMDATPTATTAEDKCAAELDALTTSWNDMTQAERDSYMSPVQQDGINNITGYDEYMASKGYPGQEWPGDDTKLMADCVAREGGTQ